MIKRLLCLACVLVLCFSHASAEEAQPEARRFDFDLTFSLNPDALPAKAQRRARGYAELLDCLELRGDLILDEQTQSFDMNTSLFFRSKPDVSIPFRFYGTPGYLFLTSPIIGNETLLFNMGSLAEFAIKVRKSLETPLPALALLYPFVYQYNFWNVWRAWEEYTGPADVSREISADQIAALSDAWAELLSGDNYLNVWMTALYSVSSAPEAVEAELNGIPSYLLDFVSIGEPLSVEIGEGTERWENAAGMTLFSREHSDQSDVWTLSLPQDENRYATRLNFNRGVSDSSFSFSMDGSMLREKTVLPPGLSEEDFFPVTGEDEEEADEDEAEYASYEDPGDESDYEEEYADEYSSVEDEEDDQWPENMIQFSVAGESIPLTLPASSSFSLSASVSGALYPNADFTVQGRTEENGDVSVSVCKPSPGADPIPLFSCEGSVIPDPSPAVMPVFPFSSEKTYGTFNLFSFSEYYVALFKEFVTEPLIRGLLDFVAEAPTSACQSLLDDLTDSGVLNMMMDQ